MVSLAIQFEGLGKVKIAMMIDKQIEKIAKKSKKKHEKIKETQQKIDTSVDDDRLGLEVRVFTVTDEDDGNKNVFYEPSKI